MATVELEQQQLLIGGEWTPAAGGGTFERANPFTRRGRSTVAAAARPRGRAPRRRRGRGGVPRAGRARRRPSAAPLLTEAADLLMERAPEIAAIMTEEVGAHVRLGHVQLRPRVADAARGGRPGLRRSSAR